MQNFEYHLIGNGNLASALAAHFTKRGMVFRWFKADEMGRYYTAADESSKKTLSFFAVSDTAIRPIWEELKGLNKNSIYVHFSASIGLKLGTLLSQSVCLHPMYTFPDRSEVDFANVPFSFQAAGKQLAVLRAIFPQSRIVPMTVEKPELYHLLGVFASNFQFALLSICEKLAAENGLHAADVKMLLLPIMKQTLRNYEKSETLFSALSGPAKRGDELAIQKHEVALRKFDLKTEELYKMLTEELQNLKK
jgi:predicted short-subunit dehydrogenase-like oxidoreductase (DUF2520 family)